MIFYTAKNVIVSSKFTSRDCDMKLNMSYIKMQWQHSPMHYSLGVSETAVLSQR